MKANVLILSILTTVVCLQAPDASAQSTRGGAHRASPSRPSISHEKAYHIASAYYRAILFREGEAAGMDYWMGAITSSPSTANMVAAAGAFARSAEFYQNIYRRYSHDQILTNIHQVFFGRDMTTREARQYVRMFRDGQTKEALEMIVSTREFSRNFL